MSDANSMCMRQLLIQSRLFTSLDITHQEFQLKSVIVNRTSGDNKEKKVWFAIVAGN